MADMSNFQLDEETLRRIEEEAMREVEIEFQLDEETLLEIEREARREAGIESLDLGNDFLDEIRLDVNEIEDDELKSGWDEIDFDSDDLLGEQSAADEANTAKFTDQPGTKAPSPAPQPTVFSKDNASFSVKVVDHDLKPGMEGSTQVDIDEAKSRALEEAKKAAREKAEKRAVAKAKHAARKRATQHIHNPHAANLEALERDADKKPNTLVTMLALMGIFVILGTAGGIFIIAKNRQETERRKEELANPTIKRIDSQGNVITEEDIDAQKIMAEIMMVTKKNANLDNIAKTLELIEEVRTKYPDYAAKERNQIILQKKEDMLKKWQQTMQSFGD